MSTKFDTFCGLVCETCEFLLSGKCAGCISSGGKPFHGACDVADCAIKRGRRFCGECEKFPCETLNRYSFDKEHGDNGARIENARRIKKALVAEAREGLDPVAYCGFSCDNCFLGEWCGGCRSDYNCCSYATICEGGVCPQAACCAEKGLDGCWECGEVDVCGKGFYANEAKGEYACRAAALFVRAHGKQASLEVIKAVERDFPNDAQKQLNARGSAQAVFEFLETYLKK